MNNDSMEYVTIVADSFEDVMQESRARKLAEHNFSILHKISRHQLHDVSGQAAANSSPKVVATFFRSAVNA